MKMLALVVLVGLALGELPSLGERSPLELETKTEGKAPPLQWHPIISASIKGRGDIPGDKDPDDPYDQAPYWWDKTYFYFWGRFYYRWNETRSVEDMRAEVCLGMGPPMAPLALAYDQDCSGGLGSDYIVFINSNKTWYLVDGFPMDFQLMSDNKTVVNGCASDDDWWPQYHAILYGGGQAQCKPESTPGPGIHHCGPMGECRFCDVGRYCSPWGMCGSEKDGYKRRGYLRHFSDGQCKCTAPKYENTTLTRGPGNRPPVLANVFTKTVQAASQVPLGKMRSTVYQDVLEGVTTAAILDYGLDSATDPDDTWLGKGRIQYSFTDIKKLKSISDSYFTLPEPYKSGKDIDGNRLCGQDQDFRKIKDEKLMRWRLRGSIIQRLLASITLNNRTYAARGAKADKEL